VRLLGIDRPGYGRSDPNPRAAALGVAEDLGVLCTAIGVDRVAVLGVSVGAPFAWPARSGGPSGWAGCCCPAR
jgi:pimeloyl-ACP methyl ester carboxylesterase